MRKRPAHSCRFEAGGRKRHSSSRKFEPLVLGKHVAQERQSVPNELRTISEDERTRTDMLKFDLLLEEGRVSWPRYVADGGDCR